MSKYIILIFSLLIIGCKKDETSPPTPTPAIPVTGLIAYYPMNGNANDSSTLMNHGTLNGGITTTTNRHNKLNKALEFDGSGYIEIPSLSGLQYKPISYSVWLYFESYLPSSAGHKFMSIIGRQEQFNIECGMLGLLADTNVESGLYDNTFLYWMGASSTPDVPSSLAKPEINKWTHLVFTQGSNGAFKLYFDGELVNSGSLTNAQTANISFRIGAGIDAHFYPWIGKLDDIRIYNRVLNNDEIQILSQE